jgi:nitrogen fixation-related uncharacterized protein
MDPVVYIVGGIVLGGVFFATAIYAFSWASKSGQMRDFDKGATVIFDEDEPLGEQTDFFPSRRKGARKAPRLSPDSRT